jgi:hypothetical protein
MKPKLTDEALLRIKAAVVEESLTASALIPPEKVDLVQKLQNHWPDLQIRFFNHPSGNSIIEATGPLSALGGFQSVTGVDLRTGEYK